MMSSGFGTIQPSTHRCATQQVRLRIPCKSRTWGQLRHQTTGVPYNKFSLVYHATLIHIWGHLSGRNTAVPYNKLGFECHPSPVLGDNQIVKTLMYHTSSPWRLLSDNSTRDKNKHHHSSFMLSSSSCQAEQLRYHFRWHAVLWEPELCTTDIMGTRFGSTAMVLFEYILCEKMCLGYAQIYMYIYVHIYIYIYMRISKA